MFRYPNSELIESIKNVLNSDFTSKEISDYCDISYTTINELRNGKRDLDKCSLQICRSLYSFATKNYLNQEFLDHERRKGHHKYIPLSLPIKRILVSLEPHDLFAYGILKITDTDSDYQKKTNTLEHLNISNSVFITDKGSVYDTSEFGYQFNCGYGGSGPTNLVQFLEKYSKLSTQELKEVIFNNSVVEYNFELDEITGFPSKIPGRSADFYLLNGKLIIVLNNFDNHINHPKRETLDLNSAAGDIQFLVSTLENYYGFSSQVNLIKYIPNAKVTNGSIYNRNTYNRPIHYNNDIHIVFEFSDYEIWLPYCLYQTKGDIFMNEELYSLMQLLGIQYTPQKNALGMITQKYTPIEDIQELPISYSENDN